MAAIHAARDYLCGRPTEELLRRVGQTIAEVPRAEHLDKRFIQASYRGDLTRPPDDLLTGQGVFYITEQRKLFLDCTAGHYQMTWGYNHPELNALVSRGHRRRASSGTTTATSPAIPSSGSPSDWSRRPTAERP